MKTVSLKLVIFLLSIIFYAFRKSLYAIAVLSAVLILPSIYLATISPSIRSIPIPLVVLVLAPVAVATRVFAFRNSMEFAISILTRLFLSILKDFDADSFMLTVFVKVAAVCVAYPFIG